MNEFTEQDLKDWKTYERVRKGGRYNMFMPEAQQATMLDRNRYLWVLKNYSKLKAAASTTPQRT